MALSVRRGDIGDSEREAVVRPVRSDGEGVTAAGRRLGMLAGSDVEGRLATMGALPVGGAIVTPSGGTLSARFIIHAVLQSAEEPLTSHTVQRALVNALRRARDLGIRSVAVPPMGTGAGNLVAEDAAHRFVEVLLDHLREGEAPTALEIVVESEYEEELFLREIAAAQASGGP